MWPIVKIWDPVHNFWVDEATCFKFYTQTDSVERRLLPRPLMTPKCLLLNKCQVTRILPFGVWHCPPPPNVNVKVSFCVILQFTFSDLESHARFCFQPTCLALDLTDWTNVDSGYMDAKYFAVICGHLQGFCSHTCWCCAALNTAL